MLGRLRQLDRRGLIGDRRRGAVGGLRGDRARSGGVIAGMAAIGGSCVLMGLAGNFVTLMIAATTIGAGSGMLNAATSSLVAG